MAVNLHIVHHSQDCGFGYGGDGVCVGCEEGTFSTETGVDPCRRCTQCNLLNRLVEAECSPTADRLCGRCLPGLVTDAHRRDQHSYVCWVLNVSARGLRAQVL